MHFGPNRGYVLLWVLILFGWAFHVAAEPGKPVRIEPVQVDQDLRNSGWTQAMEAGFMKRAHAVVAQTASGGRYGNTFFENEKRSYALAMLSLLAGYDEPALKFLQENDNPGHWSTHTEGVDFYACFTLKHQVRKYFYFGDRLDPAYKARMKRAKIWTEKEPLNRPHHAYEKATGWGPNAKNSWVDVRNTDNLKLMRDTSVYLFAEEAGNEATRLLYRDKIKTFITSLYYVGQGEWDSENYLGHSIAPLLNLYDFAKDKQVQQLAKAGLDFMAASLAVKYYRGGYNGPSRRDYNHPYPLGGSAAFFGWLWFGDSPIDQDALDHIELDAIHVMTSAYRPPAAVVALALKQFEKPVEITASKGRWEAWRDLKTDRPSYYETHFFGENFQFGTLARGTQHPDVNGFKIQVKHDKRGADTVVAGPISDPLKLGSSQYNDELLAPNSAVGHNGNMAIYLTQQSDHPYLWLVPSDANVRVEKNVTFIKMPAAVIAVWPISASSPMLDKELTDRVRFKEKTNKKTGEVTRLDHWTHASVLKSLRKGDGVYGFAVEVYDGKDQDDFIRRAMKVRPETSERAARGAVAITAVSNRRVRLQWGNTLDAIGIWCDGKKREWSQASERSLFHTRETALINLPWQDTGTLRIEAGGHTFSSTVDRSGEAEFKQ